MAELLRTERLTRRYVMGETLITAVDGIHLTIEEGEFIAIVGRSGSGKSTLLNLFGGLDRPTSGDIYFQGRRLSELSDDELALHRRAKIGFVFQSFNLIATRTALQNVELPLILAGVERGDRAKAMLESVGLGARLDHLPKQLSGGEQQRVAVARALVHDPPLLLCDEPTGNLDTKTAEEIMRLLEDLNRRGKTVILVTHDRALASRHARRTVEMSDGRIAVDTGKAA